MYWECSPLFTGFQDFARLAVDLVPGRHPLRGLAHLQRAVQLLHAGVDEPPAEGGVVRRLRAARERAVRLPHHPRGPCHALDPAGDHHLGAARLDLVRRRDRRLHAGAAEPVDRLARHLDGEAGQQQAHTRHVAVVLAGLVGAAEHHVVDLVGPDARALDRLPDHQSGQVVRPDVLQLAAVPAHRRARRRHDHRLAQLGHVNSLLCNKHQGRRKQGLRPSV